MTLLKSWPVPSRGDAVRSIQRALNRLGFGPLVVDGIFGRGTDSAVRLFQKAEKLDIDGIVGPKTLAILQKPLTPEDEPVVLKALRALGYDVHEDGQCNIIGVRSSNANANSFDDKILLLWKSHDSWQEKSYPATCDPGTYWLENPMRVDGTAILRPGQYVDTYKFDLHAGRYETLCQRGGTVKVWRDANKDETLDHIDESEIEGWFGINIHHAGTDSTNVEKWSAGCQVFKRLEDWEEAVQIWKSTGSEWFTYTLINDKDLDS